MASFVSRGVVVRYAARAKQFIPKAHLRPERVKAVHHSFLERPDEFLINARSDKRRGGIADTDRFGAGLHLRAGIAQFLPAIRDQFPP